MTATAESPRPAPVEPPAPQPSWVRQHWYGLGLAIAAAVAAVIRFVNVLVWVPSCDVDVIASVEKHVPYRECAPNEFRIWGDALYSYAQGYLLSQGHGFSDGATWFKTGGARIVPSAGDPPLYAMFLGVLQKVGLSSPTSQRLACSVLGVIGVVLIAMAARRIGGRRAGIIAGLLAATYPLLWINDGMMLSESLYVPMIALVLLFAYRFWDAPSFGNAAWLGAIVALAALTRAEAIVLFGVLIIPLLWGMRELTRKRRVGLLVTCWAVGLALMMPWFGYNLTRFNKPVLMTAGTGAVLSAANCDTTYYGDYIGYYANCFDEYVAAGTAQWPDPDGLDESERDKVAQDAAVAYIKAHKGSQPRVMATRVLRMFDLYNPDIGAENEPLGQNVRVNWAVEGRGKWPSRIGFLDYFLLLPFAVGGLVLMVRRRLPVSPVIAMPLVITVTAAFTFGITRYRMPVDIIVIILAAVAIDAIVSHWWRAPDGDDLRYHRGERPDAEPAAPSSDAPTDDDPGLVTADRDGQGA